MNPLADQIARLADTCLCDLRGTVLEVRGLTIRVGGPAMPVGATVRIDSGNGVSRLGEVVSFQNDQTLVMPFGTTAGLRRGDRVTAVRMMPMMEVGESLLGRVLDAMGRPIDGGKPPRRTMPHSLQPPPVDPMSRPLIDMPLATGVRAIDALTAVGRGQRLGVFAPPGVGKSTLLGMMARGTAADVIVVALVGERGREVQDFVKQQLDPVAMARTVVVCATGDESPLLRIRAAQAATSIAEFFRDRGADVLLIMDSLTRFCQAQRQVGLAAGEPPATKGYTPSVFASLPILLERAGRSATGSITAFYAVLVEGDELDDPIAEAARGVLDGHLVLSRALAERGHWPAVDVLASISRVADAVTDSVHQQAASLVRRLLSAYRDVEDLLNIGAYAAGGNPDFDLAIACKPAIDQLLQQGRQETHAGDFARTRKQLLALRQVIEQQRRQPPRTGRPSSGNTSRPVPGNAA